MIGEEDGEAYSIKRNRALFQCPAAELLGNVFDANVGVLHLLPVADVGPLAMPERGDEVRRGLLVVPWSFELDVLSRRVLTDAFQLETAKERAENSEHRGPNQAAQIIINQPSIMRCTALYVL